MSKVITLSEADRRGILVLIVPRFGYFIVEETDLDEDGKVYLEAHCIDGGHLLLGLHGNTREHTLLAIEGLLVDQEKQALIIRCLRCERDRADQRDRVNGLRMASSHRGSLGSVYPVSTPVRRG